MPLVIFQYLTCTEGSFSDTFKSISPLCGVEADFILSCIFSHQYTYILISADSTAKIIPFNFGSHVSSSHHQGNPQDGCITMWLFSSALLSAKCFHGAACPMSGPSQWPSEASLSWEPWDWVLWPAHIHGARSGWSWKWNSQTVASQCWSERAGYPTLAMQGGQNSARIFHRALEIKIFFIHLLTHNTTRD